MYGNRDSNTMVCRAASAKWLFNMDFPQLPGTRMRDNSFENMKKFQLSLSEDHPHGVTDPGRATYLWKANLP